MMDESEGRRAAVLEILRGNGTDGATCAEAQRRLAARGLWGTPARSTVRRDLGALALQGLIRSGGDGYGWRCQYQYRLAPIPPNAVLCLHREGPDTIEPDRGGS